MMWKLYDQLIEQVPDTVRVDHIHVGPVWTLVHAGPYCGFAVTVNEQELPIPSFQRLIGTDLRWVASLCKSWDFLEASVGTAALNAYHNSPRTALSIEGMRCTKNAFTDYAEAVKNKKAAIIGHFFNLEKFLTQAACISVLERKPWPGDYPDSACEYLLPEQDFVFITGSAFINKTLPRLLQLSESCQTIVLGPSTPMSPILFDYGADELSGLSPDYLEPEKAEIAGRGNVKMTTYGRRVRLQRSAADYNKP
ncbi:DUF364 domain-containing protein [bacterium 210820-DFI.6.37]|nr:DUF364 domain-containing protein [bacterium 210820-DFI.6.37]